MIPLRQHLAGYLAAAGLGLTDGTNLFRSTIPTDWNPATLAVLLTPSGGSPTLVGLPVTRPRCQITARCTVQDTAWAMAAAIHAALDGQGPFIWGSGSPYSYVQSIKATSPPSVLPLDENKAWRVVATYELEIGAL